MLEKNGIWSVFCGKTSTFCNYLLNRNKTAKLAFTLTEMLIALVVVAILAVLILPVVTTRAQNKSFALSYEAQVKQMLNSLTGLHVLENKTNFKDTMMYVSHEVDDYANSSGAYIKKYMKVSKYCGNTPGDCFADRYYEYSNNDRSDFSKDPIKGACALLKNGASICLKPQIGLEGGAMDQISGWIDLNGPKGPNVYGRDLRTFKIDLNESLAYSEEDPDVVIMPDEVSQCIGSECNPIPNICLSDPTSEECCKQKVPAGKGDLCCPWHADPNDQYYSICYEPPCPEGSTDPRCIGRDCNDHAITGPDDACCAQKGGPVNSPACCTENDSSEYCCSTVNSTSLACCKAGINSGKIVLNEDSPCCQHQEIFNANITKCKAPCKVDEDNNTPALGANWRKGRANQLCCDYLSRRKEILKVGSAEGAGPNDACCMFEDVYKDSTSPVASHCCRLQKFPIVQPVINLPKLKVRDTEEQLSDLCCTWRFTEADLDGKSWLKTHDYLSKESDSETADAGTGTNYDARKFDTCCPYALSKIATMNQDGTWTHTASGTWGDNALQKKVWQNCCSIGSLENKEWSYNSTKLSAECCHFFVTQTNEVGYGRAALREIDPRTGTMGKLRQHCCGYDEFKNYPECCSMSQDGLNLFRKTGEQWREICCMPGPGFPQGTYTEDETQATPSMQCCLDAGKDIINEKSEWFWSGTSLFKARSTNRLDGCCYQGKQMYAPEGKAPIKQLRKYEKWMVNCCYLRHNAFRGKTDWYETDDDFILGCCTGKSDNPASYEAWERDDDTTRNEDCCYTYGRSKDSRYSRTDNRWLERCCGSTYTDSSKYPIKHNLNDYEYYIRDAQCCKRVTWVAPNEKNDGNDCCTVGVEVTTGVKMRDSADPYWFQNCCEYVEQYSKDSHNGDSSFKSKYRPNCCYNDKNTATDGNRLPVFGKGKPNVNGHATIGGEHYQKECCQVDIATPDEHNGDDSVLTGAPSENCCKSMLSDGAMVKDYDGDALTSAYRGRCCRHYSGMRNDIDTVVGGRKLNCGELWICQSRGKDHDEYMDPSNDPGYGLPSCCSSMKANNKNEIWRGGCCEFPKDYENNKTYRQYCCSLSPGVDYTRDNIASFNNSSRGISDRDQKVYCCKPDIADNGYTPSTNCCRWFKDGRSFNLTRDKYAFGTDNDKEKLSERYQIECCNQSSGAIGSATDYCSTCSIRWKTGVEKHKPTSAYDANREWQQYDFIGCCTTNEIYGTYKDDNLWLDNCCNSVGDTIDSINKWYGSHKKFREHCCGESGGEEPTPIDPCPTSAEVSSSCCAAWAADASKWSALSQSKKDSCCANYTGKDCPAPTTCTSPNSANCCTEWENNGKLSDSQKTTCCGYWGEDTSHKSYCCGKWGEDNTHKTYCCADSTFKTAHKTFCEGEKCVEHNWKFTADTSGGSGLNVYFYTESGDANAANLKVEYTPHYKCKQGNNEDYTIDNTPTYSINGKSTGVSGANIYSNGAAMSCNFLGFTYVKVTNNGKSIYYYGGAGVSSFSGTYEGKPSTTSTLTCNGGTGNPGDAIDEPDVPDECGGVNEGASEDCCNVWKSNNKLTADMAATNSCCKNHSNFRDNNKEFCCKNSTFKSNNSSLCGSACDSTRNINWSFTVTDQSTRNQWTIKLSPNDSLLKAEFTYQPFDLDGRSYCSRFSPISGSVYGGGETYAAVETNGDIGQACGIKITSMKLLYNGNKTIYTHSGEAGGYTGTYTDCGTGTGSATEVTSFTCSASPEMGKVKAECCTAWGESKITSAGGTFKTACCSAWGEDVSHKAYCCNDTNFKTMHSSFCNSSSQVTCDATVTWDVKGNYNYVPLIYPFEIAPDGYFYYTIFPVSYTYSCSDGGDLGDRVWDIIPELDRITADGAYYAGTYTQASWDHPSETDYANVKMSTAQQIKRSFYVGRYEEPGYYVGLYETDETRARLKLVNTECVVLVDDQQYYFCSGSHTITGIVVNRSSSNSNTTLFAKIRNYIHNLSDTIAMKLFYMTAEAKVNQIQTSISMSIDNSKEFIAAKFNDLKTAIAKLADIRISARKPVNINSSAAKKLTKNKFKPGSAVAINTITTDQTNMTGVKTSSWHCCVPDHENPTKECCEKFKARKVNGVGFYDFEKEPKRLSEAYIFKCCNDYNVCPDIDACTPDDVASNSLKYQDCMTRSRTNDSKKWGIPQCCACLKPTRVDNDDWRKLCCPQVIDKDDAFTYQKIGISTKDEYRTHCCTTPGGSEGSVRGTTTRDERCCLYTPTNANTYCCGKKQQAKNTRETVVKWGNYQYGSYDSPARDMGESTPYRDACCNLSGANGDQFCTCEGLYNKYTDPATLSSKLGQSGHSAAACCGDLNYVGKSGADLFKKACCIYAKSSTSAVLGHVNTNTAFRNICCDSTSSGSSAYSCIKSYSSACSSNNTDKTGEGVNANWRDWRCCTSVVTGGMPNSDGEKIGSGNAFCCSNISKPNTGTGNAHNNYSRTQGCCRAEGLRYGDYPDAWCCTYDNTSAAATEQCCKWRKQGVNTDKGTWTPWLTSSDDGTFRNQCCTAHKSNDSTYQFCTCEYNYNNNKGHLTSNCCTYLFDGYPGHTSAAGAHGSETDWKVYCCTLSRSKLVGTDGWKNSCCRYKGAVNGTGGSHGYYDEESRSGCCTYRASVSLFDRSKDNFTDTTTVDGCCGTWSGWGDKTVYHERCCNNAKSDTECCTYMYNKNPENHAVFYYNSPCCKNSALRNKKECQSPCERWLDNDSRYYKDTSGQATITDAQKAECCQTDANIRSKYKEYCCKSPAPNSSSTYALDINSYRECCSYRTAGSMSGAGGKTVYYISPNASCTWANVASNCSPYSYHISACTSATCGSDVNEYCCKNQRSESTEHSYGYTCCDAGYTSAFSSKFCKCGKSWGDRTQDADCCKHHKGEEWCCNNTSLLGNSDCCSYSSYNGNHKKDCCDLGYGGNSRCCTLSSTYFSSNKSSCCSGGYYNNDSDCYKYVSVSLSCGSSGCTCSKGGSGVGCDWDEQYKYEYSCDCDSSATRKEKSDCSTAKNNKNSNYSNDHCSVTREKKTLYYNCEVYSDDGDFKEDTTSVSSSCSVSDTFKVKDY